MSDPAGAPVARAHISIRNEETNSLRTSETDGRGYFHLVDLPVGVYSVGVSESGFSDFQVKDLNVSLGTTLRANAQLQLVAAKQEVTVSGSISGADTDPSQTSMTNSVGRERIEESPVRTRNALDFVLMEPNVVSTAGSSAPGQATASSGLQGSGFSFGGMRPVSNRIAIDGMENDDDFAGGSHTELSPETVQEFQVINNGISAESGGASGGAVNVVTRSGANAMHGDAFVFAQTGALNARPPIEDAPAAPDLSRYRAGAANGGAIVRDHTFYYGAFEQEHERSQAAGDIGPSVISAINSALAAGIYLSFPIHSLIPGFSPTARAETEASFRIDQQSSRDQFSLRYAFTNNREAGDAFHNDGLNDASGWGSSFLKDHTLAGSWTYTGGPNATNTVRVQLSRRNAVLRTNEASGPEMDIAGLADFGRPYQGNQNYREDHADATDTYSWSRGRHLIEAGGAVIYVHERAIDGMAGGGLLVFPSLQDFLLGQPSIYRRSFGNPKTAFAVPAYGAFLQDHWVVDQHLTIDAGIRYDLTHLPQGFANDRHNFSPRLGLAFHPVRPLVLRAGYGIFFDRYLLSALNRVMVANGVQGFEQVMDGASAVRALEATQGGLLSDPFSGVAPSIWRSDPRLRNPYSQQGSAGAQYSVARNITASANYLWVRGVRLPLTSNVNLLPPQLDEGSPVFGPSRLDPSFDSVYQMENTAPSTYNGVSFSLRVMKEDFTLDTSYTLSKATDDASNWMEQLSNPYAAWQDRGPSLFDVPQRFVLSGLFDLPIGDEEGAAPHAHQGTLVKIFSNIELAPILTVQSGLAENVLTGADTSGTESYPFSSRPVGFARNSLRTPATASLDLRLLKAIPMGKGRHLDIVAESFNLFNSVNVTSLNPFFGVGTAPAPWFGRPITAAPGRQVECSLDFEY